MFAVLKKLYEIGPLNILSATSRHIYDKFFYTPPLIKDKTHYTISYTHNNKEYKILCKNNRQRKRIVVIQDENENDVSERVEKFMGPFYDFHGVKTRPRDMGYKKLTFETLMHGKMEFEEDDEIKI